MNGAPAIIFHVSRARSRWSAPTGRARGIQRRAEQKIYRRWPRTGAVRRTPSVPVLAKLAVRVRSRGFFVLGRLIFDLLRGASAGQERGPCEFGSCGFKSLCKRRQLGSSPWKMQPRSTIKMSPRLALHSPRGRGR